MAYLFLPDWSLLDRLMAVSSREQRRLTSDEVEMATLNDKLKRLEGRV